VTRTQLAEAGPAGGAVLTSVGGLAGEAGLAGLAGEAGLAGGAGLAGLAGEAGLADEASLRGEAGEWVGSLTVRSGDAVQYRSAAAADCEAIRWFVSGLSLRTRFLRFFTPAASLSSVVLRAMCGVDRAIDVLVATHGGVIIGHAMAVDGVGSDGGQVADIGLVITDHWQSRGVGSMIMGQLVARAAARGVSVLAMDVLPENRLMLAIISHWWANAQYEFGRDSVTVRVHLPDAPAA
jgi:GNAT superfamily N-acetyltransferase